MNNHVDFLHIVLYDIVEVVQSFFQDMIENGGLSLLRSKRSSAIEEELGEPMNNTRNFTAHFNYATQYCCQDIDPGQTETIEVVSFHQMIAMIVIGIYV